MAAISKEIFKIIRRIHIRTNRTVNDFLAGAYHSAFKGKGIEFEEVREYQPGDDVRSIDWNVTARLNFPFVKSYREERELTVTLLVDLSASSLFGSSGKGKHEIIAEIGAVLAFSAIKNNDKVGIVLFTDRVEKYIPPKKGISHVLRVIRELLVYQPEGKETNINEALIFLQKVQRKRGVVFVISDFISEGISKEFALAAKRYDLTSLCVTDPLEFDFPNIGLAYMEDLETGEMRWVDTSSKEVRATLQKKARHRLEYLNNLMHKVGAGFLHLPINKDYAHALSEYFLRH